MGSKWNVYSAKLTKRMNSIEKTIITQGERRSKVEQRLGLRYMG